MPSIRQAMAWRVTGADQPTFGANAHMCIGRFTWVQRERKKPEQRRWRNGPTVKTKDATQVARPPVKNEDATPMFPTTYLILFLIAIGARIFFLVYIDEPIFFRLSGKVPGTDQN